MAKGEMRLAMVAVLVLAGCGGLPQYRPEFAQRAITQITDHKECDIFCDVSADGEYVVFSSYRRGNFDIFVKKIRERSVIQRTFGREHDLFPAFSPDTKRIAFSSNRFGSYDIFIIDAFSGMNTHQITFTDKVDEYAPDFSPDGERLVFCRIFDEGENRGEIIVADLATGLQTYITDGYLPKFSPDGRRIVFQRGDGIWTVDVDGIAETEIVQKEGFWAIHPAWSPGGAKIVYSAIPKDGVPKGDPISFIDGLLELSADIRTVRIDGTADTQITGEEGADLYPFWSSDGFIYFCSVRTEKRGFNPDIFRVEVGTDRICIESKRSVLFRPKPKKEIVRPRPKRRLYPPKPPIEGGIVEVAKDNVNIWSYPGKTVIAQVNRGDKLSLIDTSKRWYYKVILEDGRVGWVCSFFVE
jgi:TolB protein